MDKLVVYVPEDAAAPLRAAIVEAGAGAFGRYDHARSPAPARGASGRSRAPTRRSAPSATSRWSTSTGRVRAAAPGALAVVAALRPRTPTRRPRSTSHRDRRPGHLRAPHRSIGTVEATTPQEFATGVAAALPATAHGVRVSRAPSRAIPPGRGVRGAADFLLDRMAGWDVDVYPPATCGPPGGRVRREGSGRPWSTSRTGRPSGRGCRWSRRASPKRWGARWSPA